MYIRYVHKRERYNTLKLYFLCKIVTKKIFCYIHQKEYKTNNKLTLLLTLNYSKQTFHLDVIYFVNE